MKRNLSIVQRGFTLIEHAVALAIAAVTLGTALPSFDQVRQRRHLEGIAAQLETDIHHARSLAVEQQKTVRISFNAPGSSGSSCYVVHTGPDSGCACGDAEPVCTGTAKAHAMIRLDNPHPVTLRANVRSIGFEHNYGTAVPTGTITMQNQRGESLHVVVNILGRVRTCSVGTSSLGHPKC